MVVAIGRYGPSGGKVPNGFHNVEQGHDAKQPVVDAFEPFDIVIEAFREDEGRSYD